MSSGGKAEACLHTSLSNRFWILGPDFVSHFPWNSWDFFYLLRQWPGRQKGLRDCLIPNSILLLTSGGRVKGWVSTLRQWLSNTFLRNFFFIFEQISGFCVWGVVEVRRGFEDLEWAWMLPGQELLGAEWGVQALPRLVFWLSTVPTSLSYWGTICLCKACLGFLRTASSCRAWRTTAPSSASCQISSSVWNNVRNVLLNFRIDSAKLICKTGHNLIISGFSFIDWF